jgi:hypothetical protein
MKRGRFLKIYKRLSFWLTIIAIGICLLNLLGYDDKSLLLFLTSPPFWLIGTHWFVENFMHPSYISIGIKYAVTILFWFLFGFILDKSITKLLNKRKL